MKKLISLSFIVLMLFTFAFGASADIFNVGTVKEGNIKPVPTTGNILAYWEDYNHIIVKFRFTYVDSSDNYHSKPFYIGNCNLNDAYVWAKQSATGDANIIMHYCADDLNTWQTTTPAGLDAVSSTAKTDTLGYQAGVDDGNYHCARWAVIECASGSSTNADGNIMTVIIKFRKNEQNSSVTPTGEWIPLFSTRNKSNTNP